MAINLLGAGDAAVDFGNVAIGGATAFTLMFTWRAPGAFTGAFFCSKWGNARSEQAVLCDRVDTDEIEFLVSGSGAGTTGYYGVKSTDNALTTSALHRVVCRWKVSPKTNEIWINGVQRTTTDTFSNSPASIQTSSVSGFAVARQAEFAAGATADGVDGDYCEVAVWLEFVPDWMLQAYSLGLSPLNMRTANSFLYAPLVNTSGLRDIWTGGTGTNTAGTNAVHPAMYYPGHVA